MICGTFYPELAESAGMSKPIMANVGNERGKRSVHSGIESTLPRNGRKSAESAGSSQEASVSVQSHDTACIDKEYVPVTRIPNKNDLAKAVEEVERLLWENERRGVHENECNAQVTLAAGVNLKRWMKRLLPDLHRYVRFETVVEDGVTADTIDKNTKCVIIITKMVSVPHKQAVSEIKRQLGNYAVGQCYGRIHSSGGSMQYTFSGA